MTLDLRRLIDRAARWLLNYRPQPLAVGAEINRFAAKVAALTPLMPQWLRGADKAIVEKEAGEFAAHGASPELAYSVAIGLYKYSLLDVIDIADIVERDPAEVADAYFALMDHLGTDGLLTAVSGLPRDDRWHSLARLAIRDDIYGSLRALCFDVLAVGEPDETGEQKIAEWGAHQRFPGGAGPPHAVGDLCRRSLRYRDAVRGCPADPQHDQDDRNGTECLTGSPPACTCVGRTSTCTSIVNHATMVTILEEARVDFLHEPFADDILTIGLLIHEVRVLYKANCALPIRPAGHHVDQAASRGRLHAGLRGACPPARIPSRSRR